MKTESPITQETIAKASPAPRPLATWGLPVFASLLGALALVIVWVGGSDLNLESVDLKKTVSVWILGVLLFILLLHAIVSRVGAYKLAGAVYSAERERGSQQAAVTAAQNRDPRLQHLHDELRHTHGIRWRYRLSWLMLTGSDKQIDEVAPGLKQSGAMLIAGTVLLHAAPDDIDSAHWRRQIKRLRRRRPIDVLVHITRLGKDEPRDATTPRTLATIAADLGWAAPITLLHAVKATGTQPTQYDPIGTFVHARTRQAMQRAADALSNDLANLEIDTALSGVPLCCSPQHLFYLAQVSQYITEQREKIVETWRSLVSSGWLRAPLAGVIFAPVFDSGVHSVPIPVEVDPGTAVAARTQPLALESTWQEIGRRLRHRSGRRVGLHWPNALAASVMLASIASCIAMTVSFIGNRQLTREAQAVANAALDASPATPAALRAQRALQLQIDTLEHRQQHGAPWYLRAGLSRNDALLEALWRPYAAVAARNLQQPVVASLEARLDDMNRTRADALQTERARQNGYDTLKAYLMLSHPQRTDATFLAKMLVSSWPLPAGMSAGERDDLAQQLARFYAAHLNDHPEWRIHARDSLIARSRNTLINQIGLANDDDTVYRAILDDANGKYADASLATLLNGADARGLFSTAQTVSGIYTRAAWDGKIAEAIEQAANEQHTIGDWVLSGDRPAPSTQAAALPPPATASATDKKRASEALKQRLTARYFADYTIAWQRILNSIQWQPAANLNAAIDQLTRLADAQTSPLIALMKSVQYQAQAGRPSQALGDTLVRKAQSLIGNGINPQTSGANPLDRPFGALLALMGDNGANTDANNGDHPGAAPITAGGVSLAHYLTVTTTMRLKLQQIAASPDAQAMARSLAQAVFQGKFSELTQARDDAALTAASLGTQWSGFGDALFARPLDTAWQTILQPAAASLNEAWRTSIAMPFKTSFDGRYPFFDTNADASFAELGRYVRPDTGLISRFLTTELAGMLKRQGDQWRPDELAPQALRFDPAFLAAIRQLSGLGALAYAQGDAGYHFEIMALPTASVTRTELSVDGKPIVYFNQKESWTALTWPGNGLNGRAGLMWEMVNAGLRQAFDATGDWAFLRLLAQAQIKPLDSTRYELTWNEPNAAPLRYVMRTQVGAGPLALLKLRGFRMPERIFSVGKDAGALAAAALPPLPPIDSPFQ
jgi:type VI secretion system protein ImpL